MLRSLAIVCLGVGVDLFLIKCWRLFDGVEETSGGVMLGVLWKERLGAKFGGTSGQLYFTFSRGSIHSLHMSVLI